MHSSTEPGLERLRSFLAGELRAYPGRLNLMLRSLLGCTLVIVVSMTLQVPFLALSLTVVFYVTQTNVVVTRLVGSLFVVGSTLAVGLSILLLKFTYDQPLLRILGASLLLFCSTFLMRTTRIGTVFFIVGIVVIYSQTFADLTDQGEVILRQLLWVWVAVNYAIVLTLLVNTLFLPVEPQKQLREHLLRQLRSVADRLLPKTAMPPTRIVQADIQRSILVAQKLLRFACMRDPRYRAEQGAHLTRIGAISRLFMLARQLPETPPASDVPLRLQQAVCVLQAATEAGETLLPSADLARLDTRELPAVYEEIRRVLLSLANQDMHPDSAVASGAAAPTVSDAFTNPVYVQFSLKTLLAALLCYLFYTASDWQGAHTIMLTCLIVAQPNLGAIGQRSLLRVAGVLLGSALALGMMVWVVPHLDDIFGLLCMALPVIALGSWISAGSERISYAGTQIVFTFALALMDNFAPSTNLTEIRDRLLGILLGVGVSWVIHALLWPEAEGEALRQRLARLLRATAASLRSGGGSAPDQKLWSELGDSQNMLARVALEPGWQAGEGQQEVLTLRLQEILVAVQTIILISDSLHTEIAHTRLKPELHLAFLEVREQASVCLERYADWLSEHPDGAPISIGALDESWRNHRHDFMELRKSPLSRLLDELVEDIERLTTLHLFDKPR
ncbi:FUSC family protein [Pseudomonas sp. 22526]|uniref:FUSC family protein n=1 Tax=Pseudomonas sp. 22526 TaxID=3453937 RepID=UPI003F861D81